MRTQILQPPPNDIGFVANRRGDIIVSRPHGTLHANTGWVRDGVGNLIPSTVEPTSGYWRWDADQNLVPRRA